MGGKNEKKLQKIIVNAIACQYEIDTANNVGRLKTLVWYFLKVEFYGVASKYFRSWFW